jgi:hypothetical protein
MANNTSAKALRIPITNIWDGGAYSAEVSIGSAGTVANLLLDTGSATLAVESSVYDGRDDATLMISSLAQLITYAGGGFAGPVISTDVSIGGAGNAVVLRDASMAIAVVQQGSLGAVSGVMGLAYGGINPGYDFAPYFAAKGRPRSTFPWPFGTGDMAAVQAELQGVVASYAVQPAPITPCFEKLETEGVVANRFAFYSLRSSISFHSGADPATLAKDPLNNGVFVLGGGAEETDLYQGDFVDVAVVHDLFYNANLVSVRVGDGAPSAAAALQPEYRDLLFSNAIVDSGNVKLRLASDVHQAVVAGLAQMNPAFGEAVQSAQNDQPVATASLNLTTWPTLYFAFTGVKGDAVELSVAPQTYWQADFPAAGQAVFKIGGPVSDANQSNFGLPLMNNYYTVFDRSQGPEGVIRFAPIRPPA